MLMIMMIIIIIIIIMKCYKKVIGMFYDNVISTQPSSNIYGHIRITDVAGNGCYGHSRTSYVSDIRGVYNLGASLRRHVSTHAVAFTHDIACTIHEPSQIVRI